MMRFKFCFEGKRLRMDLRTNVWSKMIIHVFQEVTYDRDIFLTAVIMPFSTHTDETIKDRDTKRHYMTMYVFRSSDRRGNGS